MISNRLALWLLDRAPRWLRSRWPLRRYYWQEEELRAAEAEAQAMRADLDWTDP